MSHQGVCFMCLNWALCSSGGMGGWQCGSAGSGGIKKTLKLNPLLPFLTLGHGLCCWCAWVSLEHCCCPSSGSAGLTCSASVASLAAQGTCRKGLSLLPYLVGKRAWMAPSRCCAPQSIPLPGLLFPQSNWKDTALGAEMILKSSKCPFCISSDTRGV